MYLKFEDAYKQYLIYIENRQKIQSKENLKEKFENKILPYFKNFNIYDISELDYMNFQNEIEKFNYSNNTKRNLHYLISGFFNYCVLYHHLKYNIAKKVGNFKMNNSKVKMKHWNLKDFKKFISNIDNIIYKVFFEFMYFTGCRPGEVMALKFSDLDNNKIISINKTISEHSIEGSRVIDTPKSLNSVREIKIDKKLYKHLLQLKSIYDKKYCVDNFDYFIFGGVNPLAPTTINRYKNKACNKANLKPIQLREFRRSHATLLYNLNIPMQFIKQRLGHSDINTTMKYYVDLENSKEKRVIKTLNLIRLLF